MSVEIVKMSSKGQIVIPLDVRQGIKANEGSLFAVMSNKDTVILKKMDIPSKESLIKDLAAVAKEGKARLQKKGIQEADLPAIAEKARKK